MRGQPPRALRDIIGRSTGRLREVPSDHNNGFINSYQQSKYEAERIVLEALREVPAAIMRMSTIIGDSYTGWVRKLNFFHEFLKLFRHGSLLPLAPGDPAAPIDLIPTDWAIPALAHLFESAFVPGRIYQICAGPEASLTTQQLIEITLGIFESHPLGRRWLPIRIPELVPLPEYEAYTAEVRKEGDVFANEYIRILDYFLPHLALHQAFENRHVTEGLAGSGIVLPPIGNCYEKVVRYLIETNWRRREAS